MIWNKVIQILVRLSRKVDIFAGILYEQIVNIMKKLLAILVAVMPLLTSCFEDLDTTSLLNGTWVLESITNIKSGEKSSPDEKHTITFKKSDTGSLIGDSGKFTEVKGSKKFKGTYVHHTASTGHCIEFTYEDGNYIEWPFVRMGMNAESFTVEDYSLEYHYVRK